jgi:glycosyltransferase involved in cell wall biosynthesis
MNSRDTHTHSRTQSHDTPRRSVEIVIPVFNEQRVLARNVRALHAYVRGHFDFPFTITVADNASTDTTLQIARALARELEDVTVLHLERKGRGRALRAAWSTSDAVVVAYMDVDLSTDLAGLAALLEPLLDGHADIAIGSRLTSGAQVERGIKRELISRAYNLLLRALLGAGFSDAQCGFKAGRREIVQPLLADVQDTAWFFDTELLYLAQRSRLAIREVPVRWVDDPDSRVHIVATARDDLLGIMRLRRASSERDRRAGLTTAAPFQPGRATPSSLAVSAKSALSAVVSSSAGSGFEMK